MNVAMAVAMAVEFPARCCWRAVRALRAALMAGSVLGLCCLLAHANERVAQADGTATVTKSDRESRQRPANAEPATQAAPDGTPTNAPIRGPGDYSFSIVHGGLTRLYRVHVPTGYSASNPVPMVLSFHGGGGNMDIEADDRYYGLLSKSDRAGYVAVFPNGFSRLASGKLATWNAGSCCAGARDENVDDVGFVREIVKRLRAQLNIDPDRIFADGMSNGAMMSYRLACELSSSFKAIASVAGSDGTRNCTPEKAVSILEIHARNDEMVLFGGGAGRSSSQLADFASVPETIGKWVRLNGCNATPHRVFETAGAYCDAYSSCRDGTEVRLCVTEAGGHSWPGGRKVRTGEPGSTALSATDVIWDFFKSR